MPSRGCERAKAIEERVRVWTEPRGVTKGVASALGNLMDTLTLMKKLYEAASTAYFIFATVALLTASFLLVGFAVWEIGSGLFASGIDTADRVRGLLDGVGLMIIGFAVVEAATFIAEEELFRKRELRSTRESRRSITKFITIIVIAASLEALVMVFKTSREQIPAVIYPAALFASAMVALVALGVYQWLSSRVEHEGGNDSD